MNYPTFGMNGWSSAWQNGAENTHHYAGHLLAGFVFGALLNSPLTGAREGAEAKRQQRAHPGSELTVDMADVRLGVMAGIHGNMLANGLPPQALAFLIRQLRWP